MGDAPTVTSSSIFLQKPKAPYTFGFTKQEFQKTSDMTDPALDKFLKSKAKLQAPQVLPPSEQAWSAATGVGAAGAGVVGVSKLWSYMFAPRIANFDKTLGLYVNALENAISQGDALDDALKTELKQLGCSDDALVSLKALGEHIDKAGSAIPELKELMPELKQGLASLPETKAAALKRLTENRDAFLASKQEIIKVNLLTLTDEAKDVQEQLTKMNAEIVGIKNSIDADDALKSVQSGATPAERAALKAKADDALKAARASRAATWAKGASRKMQGLKHKFTSLKNGFSLPKGKILAGAGATAALSLGFLAYDASAEAGKATGMSVQAEIKGDNLTMKFTMPDGTEQKAVIKKQADSSEPPENKFSIAGQKLDDKEISLGKELFNNNDGVKGFFENPSVEADKKEEEQKDIAAKIEQNGLITQIDQKISAVDNNKIAKEVLEKIKDYIIKNGTKPDLIEDIYSSFTYSPHDIGNALQSCDLSEFVQGDK